MFNDSLFLQRNCSKYKKRVVMSQTKKYIYKASSKTINLLEIKRILNFISSIKSRHRLSLLPIIIDLGTITFEDKLTYVLLECICYNIINSGDGDLRLHYRCSHNIYNEGIKSSCLKYLDGTTEGRKKFTKNFHFNLYENHYRKIIKSEGFSGEQTSRTVQDIDSYLKICNIRQDYRTKVTDIIGELIDNSLEHSKSDCLIDLDVTADYEKNDCDSEDNLYCGVNIVILNFSEILIGDGLKKKIKHIEEGEIIAVNRYQDVLGAKEYHSKLWDSVYTEEDFYTISSFQHKISCRLDRQYTGGTGLTHLVRGLEEESDAYECYMLSGYRRINFIKNLLSSKENNWVGFNASGNYLSDIPDSESIVTSGLNFPGTAYNLNFVLKREEF